MQCTQRIEYATFLALPPRKKCKVVCNTTHRWNKAIKATQLMAHKMVKEYSCNCCSYKKLVKAWSQSIKLAARSDHQSIKVDYTKLTITLWLVTKLTTWFHWPWCRCPLCLCWLQLSTNWKNLGIHCWMHFASLWCLLFCQCMQVLHSQMLWWWCAWLPWLVGEFAQKVFLLCWFFTHPFPQLFMFLIEGDILIGQFGILIGQCGILFLPFHAQPLPHFGLLKCCVFALQSLGELPLHTLHLYFHGLAILTTPKTSKGHLGKRKDFVCSWWFWLHPWAKSKDSLQWLANLATKPEMGNTYTIACVNGWQTCHLLHTQWWHTHTLNHEHILP